jgi:hypothetical protein
MLEIKAKAQIEGVDVIQSLSFLKASGHEIGDQEIDQLDGEQLKMSKPIQRVKKSGSACSYPLPGALFYIILANYKVQK